MLNTDSIDVFFLLLDGFGAISKVAQVTITSLAFGSTSPGLNSSRVAGYSLSQPDNIATLLPNAFQPNTSDADRAAFNYNAYVYDLALLPQDLDKDAPGFLTVLELYTVPSVQNGQSWTNRGTLPIQMVKSKSA